MMYREEKGPSWRSYIPAQILTSIWYILHSYGHMKYLWVRHAWCVSTARDTIQLHPERTVIMHKKYSVMVLRLTWIAFQLLTLLSLNDSTCHMYLSNIRYQLISPQGEGSFLGRILFPVHISGLCPKSFWMLLSISRNGSSTPVKLVNSLYDWNYLPAEKWPSVPLNYWLFFRFICYSVSHNTSRK